MLNKITINKLFAYATLSMAFLMLNTTRVNAQINSSTINLSLSDVNMLFDIGEDFTNCNWVDAQNKLICTKRGYKGLYLINPNEDTSITLSQELGIGYNYKLINDDQYVISIYSTLTDGPLRNQKLQVLDLKVVNTVHDVLLERRHLKLTDFITTNNEIVVAKDFEITEIPIQNAQDILGKTKTDSAREFWHRSPTVYTPNGLFVLRDSDQIKISGEFSYDPTISPNGKYLCYSQKGILKIVYDNLEEYEIGSGLNAAWHTNSEYIIYQRTEDNGHYVTSSELYLYDVENKNSILLTDSKHIHEEEPSFSKTSNRIVFTDAITGSVFTADLEISK